MNIKEITKQNSLSIHTYIIQKKINNVCSKISSNTLLVPSTLHFPPHVTLEYLCYALILEIKTILYYQNFTDIFFCRRARLIFSYFAYFIPVASPTLPGKTNNHKQTHTIRYAMQHNNMTGMYQAPML